MIFKYKTKGTCSSEMIVDINGDTIKSVEIIGGCDGNTKGICSLIKGMKIDDVVKRLKGIRCGRKPTSCPDQLSIALLRAKEQQNK